MATFYGTSRADRFDGGRRGERVYGLGGDDDLYGNGGDDFLFGGNGRDLLVGGTGNDTLNGGAGSDMLAGEKGDDTLIGGGGFDYANYFYAGAGIDLSLAAGTAQDGDGGTDALASIEGVYGSRYADIIRGDAGTNELFGEAGADILIGGAGQDLTVGGAGADRFVFNDGDISDRLARADLIGDFSHGQGDTIDLSGIDANTRVAGDQAFTYVGHQAFSGVAGELRSEVIGGETVLIADTDGDKIADGFIRVDTSQAIVANDLVL